MWYVGAPGAGRSLERVTLCRARRWIHPPTHTHTCHPCARPAEFQRPSRRAVQQFAAALEGRGVPVSLRQTRGLEAAAACGQLRNQHQMTPLPEFAAAA